MRPPQACDFCSSMIEGAAFEAGQAMKVLGKNYCPACLGRAIERSKDSSLPPDLQTPRPHPPK